jgi:phytoene desaturase
MNKQAIVIGAGIAGLASALRLRKQGFEVVVFEAAGFPGGKLREFTEAGYRFDYGPSLFTMPQLVDELFSLFGEEPADHFRYIRKENICNYFWSDGTRYTVPADERKFVATAAETFGEQKQEIEKYLQKNALKYKLTAPLFIEKSLHKRSTYFSKNTFTALSRILQYDLLQSLNGVNKKFFKNKKLVQLFNRYATYNGSSPYRTPGIMSMIPHLEMHFGAFLPEGGMHDITNSLYDLAVRQGIAFRFNEKVENIDYTKRIVTGVTTASGEHRADVVVSNMDIYSTYQHLLPNYPAPQYIMKQERSSSALIFYWGVKQSFRSSICTISCLAIITRKNSDIFLISRQSTRTPPFISTLPARMCLAMPLKAVKTGS